MATIAISGNDTLVINGHQFADFADGDVAVLTFPNDIMAVKTGKNGNTIYGVNASGKQADFEIRLIRGSADDKYLNGLLSQQNLSPESFVLMQGSFIKKVGDGTGAVTSDTYVVSGGVFTKPVEGKSNVEGDTEQSIAKYTMKFSNAPRQIA